MMNKRIIKISRYILLSLILLPAYSYSITQNTDAKLWTGIKLRTDLSNKLGLVVETQPRFYDNITTFSIVGIFPIIPIN